MARIRRYTRAHWQLQNIALSNLPRAQQESARWTSSARQASTVPLPWERETDLVTHASAPLTSDGTIIYERTEWNHHGLAMRNVADDHQRLPGAASFFPRRISPLTQSSCPIPVKSMRTGSSPINANAVNLSLVRKTRCDKFEDNRLYRSREDRYFECFPRRASPSEQVIISWHYYGEHFPSHRFHRRSGQDDCVSGEISAREKNSLRRNRMVIISDVPWATHIDSIQLRVVKYCSRPL